MKKTRIKIPVAFIASRAGAETVMNELAHAANTQRTLIAERDEQVLALNQKYEQPLAACEAELRNQTEALRAWAEANPSEFPRDQKSIKMLGGTLGFRTGTPKLALLSRAWNWDKVLEAVQKALPAFVRQKPEVDKDALITQRKTFEHLYPALGVKVVQDEAFYVEPKLSANETRQSLAA